MGSSKIILFSSKMAVVNYTVVKVNHLSKSKDASRVLIFFFYFFN